MTAWRAFRVGVGRVNGAPAILAGAVAVTWFAALPLSLVVRSRIEAHLGPSATADLVARGADYDWWTEFGAQAAGLGLTFTPSVIGFAAVLDNASGLLDNRPLAPAITGVTAAWLAVWSFLSGGVLDRYARGRPTRAHGFFAACGTHFWRFVRLGFAAFGVYAAVFWVLHSWFFEAVSGRLTRDLTIERDAFAIRLGAYVVFSAVLALFALLFDYARIRIVVEDRRSALGALAASARFVRRTPGRVAALWLLNALALLALMAGYGLLAPGAPRAGLQMWLVLALGQAYIIGRHYVKLLAYASETALFQAALAHAAYTASPVVVWPDAPAVESITNAEPRTPA